ncbi:MAG TPA: cupredoxin family copper-binding protein [Solirubrobacterales bacterium]|nr:cupredoxin family copper-binding protein [Solirubrobacterales bacterium]
MRSKLLLPVLVACFAFAAFAAGCGSDDDGDSGSATVTETATEETTAVEDATEGEDETAPSGDAVRSAKVEIEDFAYDPDPVTIEEGGKVTWINRDSAPHTATAEDGSFDTGTLEEGKLGSAGFKEAGTYEYVCTIHPEMQGTVEVVAAG